MVVLIVSSLRPGLAGVWPPAAAPGPSPAPAEGWAGQATAGLVVGVLLLIAVAYLSLVWRHGRRLHAAGEMIDQFWRGLEAVLIRHHRAAEDLVRQADARGLLPDGDRERAESAWDEAEAVGRRYSELAMGYNRLVASPFNVLWNRRLERQPAQVFTPEHPGALHAVDVL